MEHTDQSSSDANWGSFSSPVPSEDPEIMALLFSNTSLADESHGWQSIEFHPSATCSDVAVHHEHEHEREHEQQQQPPPPPPPNYYYDVQNGMYYWPPQACGGTGNNNIPVSADNYYLCDPNNAGGKYSAGRLAMEFFTADHDKINGSSVRDRPTTDSLPEAEPSTFGEFAGDRQLPSGGAGTCASTGGRVVVDTGLKFLELASPSDQILIKPPSGKRRIPLLDSDKAVVADGKVSNAAAGLNPRKKSRSTADLQKSGKSSSQPRKAQKGAAKASLSDDTGLARQTSSSDSSEDDSIASQEVNIGDGGTRASSKGNNNVKTRAGRGSATDPQSLYARKRRERINERLRILQNLVPNGTKVDISTMLEEAVQYVKFLQLQIKLLSSDDLWMYAPIAYNGMDIGLDLKITPPQ